MRYLLLGFVLAGCVNQQTLTLPNDEVYSASIDNDTIVTLKKPDGIEVTFDRRGAPSVIDNLLVLMGIKLMGDNDDN